MWNREKTLFFITGVNCLMLVPISFTISITTFTYLSFFNFDVLEEEFFYINLTVVLYMICVYVFGLHNICCQHSSKKKELFITHLLIAIYCFSYGIIMVSWRPDVADSIRTESQKSSFKRSRYIFILEQAACDDLNDNTCLKRINDYCGDIILVLGICHLICSFFFLASVAIGFISLCKDTSEEEEEDSLPLPKP